MIPRRKFGSSALIFIPSSGLCTKPRCRSGIVHPSRATLFSADDQHLLFSSWMIPSNAGFSGSGSAALLGALLILLASCPALSAWFLLSLTGQLLKLSGGTDELLAPFN